MPRAPRTEKDWYAILEIRPGAGAAEVKAAHRRLARLWHPDTNAAPEAHARMQEINTARDVLLDREARAAFDLGLKRDAAARRVAADVPDPEAVRVRGRAAEAPRRTWPGHWAERPPGRPVASERRAATGAFRAAPDHTRDWYGWLGIAPGASADAVRAALGRKAAEIEGQDLTAVEVARRNAELRAANASIGTPAARAAYDRQRRTRA